MASRPVFLFPPLSVVNRILSAARVSLGLLSNIPLRIFESSTSVIASLAHVKLSRSESVTALMQ
jgi:hypothetical protein